MYTKATFLLAVMQDGQVVFDGGRVQWVHPFPYTAGMGEIRNGKLRSSGSRQVPWIASPREASVVTTGSLAQDRGTSVS